MQETTIPRSDRRFPAGKFAMGVALFGAGILGLISHYELGELIRHYWPILMIVAGVGGEIDSFHYRRNGAGLILISVGTWMLIGINGYFGMNVQEALPIGVVIYGLGLIVHALLGFGRKVKTS